MKTAAEKLLEAAEYALFPRDVVTQVDVADVDVPTTLARIALAIKFYHLPKVVTSRLSTSSGYATHQGGGLDMSWTMIERIGAKWRCRCDCGRICIRRIGKNRGDRCTPCSKGNTLNLDSFVFRKLSACAREAVNRCTRSSSDKYKDYGGRGIVVYQLWLESHLEFVKHLATLEGCDDPNKVLDREDNDGNYEPGNLRFVTRSESMLNRRCGGRYQNAV